MPSQPDPSNDYAIPDGWSLSKANLNAVLASVSERLKTLEAVKASFDDLINQGTDQALLVIQNNVGPQITALTTALDELQQATALAQGAVASLLANGVPAADVLTDTTHRFITDAQIATLNAAVSRSDVIALAIALG